MILVSDTVAAVHVAGGPGDVERLVAVGALEQADHLGSGVAKGAVRHAGRG